jgi:hypothetical protein
VAAARIDLVERVMDFLECAHHCPPRPPDFSCRDSEAFEKDADSAEAARHQSVERRHFKFVVVVLPFDAR